MRQQSEVWIYDIKFELTNRRRPESYHLFYRDEFMGDIVVDNSRCVMTTRDPNDSSWQLLCERLMSDHEHSFHDAERAMFLTKCAQRMRLYLQQRSETHA
jgi:hypothetical protein